MTSASPPSGTPAAQRLWPRVVRVILVASGLFWLVVAFRAATPLVLGDEYTYIVRGIALDRLRHLEAIAPSVPGVGNYLFLRLINLISRAHLPVDVAMKLVNVAAFLAALRVIGKLTRAPDAPWRATTLFALAAFLPTASYVAYVMPESLYFATFVGIFAVLLRAPGTRPFRLWATIGVLIAFLSLLKAHGAFVLAAFLAATLAWSLSTARIPLKRAIALCATTAGAFAVTLAVVQTLVGPRQAGGDFVGGLYWLMVRGAVPTWARLSIIAQLAAAQGAAILMLLGPSLTLLAAGILAERRRGGGRPENRLALAGLFLILLIGLVVVAISFILYGEPRRVEFRYISFTFPCVLVLAWIWGRSDPALDSRRFRAWAAAVWLLGAGYFLARLPGLQPLAGDGPELFFTYSGGEFGAFGFGAGGRYVIGGAILACALAMLHPRVRWFDAQLLALLIFFPVADLNTLRWQGGWSASQAPLRAIGEVANGACGADDAGLIALLPKNLPGQLYIALARIPRAVPIKIDPDGGVATLALRRGGCVITPLDLSPALGLPLAYAPGLALYRAETPWTVARETPFDRGVAPALLGEGWSAPEGGGIWTDGPRAVLHIDPAGVLAGEKQVVEFNAFAFDAAPGVGQRVMVSMNGRPLTAWMVHDGSYQVRLPTPPKAGAPYDLELALPDARAPASVLPGNADRRILGIGVRRMRILRPVLDPEMTILSPVPYPGQPAPRP